MMKIQYLLTFIIGICYSFGFYAQVDVNRAEPCNKKSLDRKKNARYAVWECGKLAGSVDCNEKLDYEAGSNTYTSGMDNKPFTGVCETCHNNGLLEHRIHFVNGKESGVDTTFYESGCVMVIREHIDGLRNGKWVYYYDTVTQQLAWEMNYFMGEKHGRQIFFTEKGDTTLLENYVHGKLNGEKRTYFPHSKIEKIVHYKNGIIDGKFQVYNYKGNLLQETNYVMDKKNGEFKYFYDDGTLLKVEHWTLGVKDGEFKVFFYEGNVQTTEHYVKGVKEGWFEEFYSDQKPKSRILYKKEVIQQEQRFDERGRITYNYVIEKKKHFWQRKKKKDTPAGSDI